MEVNYYWNHLIEYYVIAGENDLLHARKVVVKNGGRGGETNALNVDSCIRHVNARIILMYRRQGSTYNRFVSCREPRLKPQINVLANSHNAYNDELYFPS